jgi:hypothetical protein
LFFSGGYLYIREKLRNKLSAKKLEQQSKTVTTTIASGLCH